MATRRSLILPSNCRGIGVLWITIGLLTLIDSEHYRLLRIDDLVPPVIAQITTYLFGILAIVQGYWFGKNRGFVPKIGMLFFVALAGYLGTIATARYAEQQTSADWINLFLTIVTIISILACGRKPATKTAIKPPELQ